MKRQFMPASLYLLAVIQKPVESLKAGSTVVTPGELLVPVTGVVAGSESEARTIFVQEHGKSIPTAKLKAGEIEILCLPFGGSGGSSRDNEYEDDRD